MKSFIHPAGSIILLMFLLLPAGAFTQNVTLTTSATAAANIAQGAGNNPIAYAVRMNIGPSPVTVNSIQFTLSGTHDNNDINSIGLWFNAGNPTITGAILLNTAGVGFAAPHTYFVSFNVPMAAGSSGYFMVSTNISATATAGNTIKADGALSPAVFGFTTAQAVTNNQGNLAGLLTVIAGTATLTSSPVPAGTIAQGSTANTIVYTVKMEVTSLAVTVSSIQFFLDGTYDNNDISSIGIWFNAGTPSIAGASLLNSASGAFAAPHTYSVSSSVPISSGASGYFIISVNLTPAATIGNTVKLNGASNPLIFGFTTAPTITNNQSDLSGIQTFTGTLPLQLISFAGDVVNKKEIKLHWATMSELNTRDFEVQWSGDDQRFKPIAVLQAAHISADEHYSYLHKFPAAGNNYYRLKMSDKDGQYTYSPLVKINMDADANKILVFQNPFISILELKVEVVKNETVVFNLHSADGKMIKSAAFNLQKGGNRFAWNLTELAPGNYFISSKHPFFETIKIIKN